MDDPPAAAATVTAADMPGSGTAVAFRATGTVTEVRRRWIESATPTPGELDASTVTAMPRPPRPPIAGGTYHVTSRGNRGSPIVGDDGDRRFWLGLLENIVGTYKWVCHTYCLLTNHFHLLVETPEANISAGMQCLNGEHARWFNWRYGLRGHLFEARFWSETIDDDAHFVDVARYAALNPVRAGLVSRPERWRWTGFAATLGLVSRPAFLTTNRILAQFSDDVPEARRVFRDFVDARV
jgi:REP element-mobilizing transposase RayT